LFGNAKELPTRRFLASGRSGFYFSVVESGSVGSGSTIQLVSRDANHVSIADVQRLYLGLGRDPELLKRIEKLVALPENWKRELSLRAQTNPS
jgi:MOSC domain-containing protein YiiM